MGYSQYPDAWWSEFRNAFARIGELAYADLTTDDPGISPEELPDWIFKLALKFFVRRRGPVYTNQLLDVNGKVTGVIVTILDEDVRTKKIRLNIRDLDGKVETIGIVTSREGKLSLEKISLPVQGGVTTDSGEI